MEFHAYSSHPQGRKLSGLWYTQNMIHSGESLLVPGLILLAAISLVIYEHFSATHTWNSNRNFLAMIVVTMLPLAFLEKKILACRDPLDIMTKFSGKVLLSHASFLILRLPQHFFHEGLFSMNFVFCFIFFSMACILVPMCLRVRSARALICDNLDVCGVVVMSLAGAIMTEVFNYYFDYRLRFKYQRSFFTTLFKDLSETSALYTELLAFVPAIGMVCRVGNAPACVHDKEADVNDTRKRALALFVFLVGFYFTEDMIAAMFLWRSLPMAALGHVAHFALTFDFASFLLSHLYDPSKLDKLMGSLRNMFADACAV